TVRARWAHDRAFQAHALLVVRAELLEKPLAVADALVELVRVTAENVLRHRQRRRRIDGRRAQKPHPLDALAMTSVDEVTRERRRRAYVRHRVDLRDTDAPSDADAVDDDFGAFHHVPRAIGMTHVARHQPVAKSGELARRPLVHP